MKALCIIVHGFDFRSVIFLMEFVRSMAQYNLPRDGGDMFQYSDFALAK